MTTSVYIYTIINTVTCKHCTTECNHSADSSVYTDFTYDANSSTSSIHVHSLQDLTLQYCKHYILAAS